GKYPARLDDLAPAYLKEVPLDFMDGKPLRYRTKEDGTFLLYSVGEDGKDDGGDGVDAPAYPAWRGIMFSTWWRGREAVWRMAASEAEVKAYEAGVLASWKSKHPEGK